MLLGSNPPKYLPLLNRFTDLLGIKKSTITPVQLRLIWRKFNVTDNSKRNEKSQINKHPE